MGHVPSTEPKPGILAPKQSPQALQNRDVESPVGRPVAKHEVPGVGKRADKSLRNGRVRISTVEAPWGGSQVRAQPR